MTPIEKVLIGKKSNVNPIWIMRQAGRYLPEFKQLRSQNPNFLKLCLNSDLASKITLQPMKRFNLDAAIIFSDILVIPYALGQPIEFGGKNGPRNSKLSINKFLDTNERSFLSTLQPIYKAINKTKNILNKDKSLIAFVGAPWTLMIYLYNFKQQNKLDKDKKITIKNKIEIKSVFKKLDEFLKIHIINQKQAGADIIQIFDSWAGLIRDEDLNEYCYKPNESLVNFCKENKIPSICFPKGLKENYKNFLEKVKPDAVNIDYDIDPSWAKNNFGNICIQGGMSPYVLLEDEKIALEETEKYIEIFKNKPYIFNLGHGILPETNPSIIKKIVDRVNIIKR